MVELVRCWSGRVWVNIGGGLLAIGFGPMGLIERVWVGGRLRWHKGGG